MRYGRPGAHFTLEAKVFSLPSDYPRLPSADLAPASPATPALHTTQDVMLTGISKDSSAFIFPAFPDLRGSGRNKGALRSARSSSGGIASAAKSAIGVSCPSLMSPGGGTHCCGCLRRGHYDIASKHEPPP